MNKLTIAVDARTLGSRPSGVGMYLNDFLTQLIKYEEFKFILITDVVQSDYIKAFEERGVEIRSLGKAIYKSAGVYSYFSFVQKQLDDIKPDIFWEVNTVIPRKLRGDFKTMITIHDMFPIQYVEYFGMIYSIYFKYNLKKTLKYTDMILYNSLQTKITTEEIFKEAKDIRNCNAYIISNPLEHAFESVDKDYFLYVGNMEKRKGVDLLLKGYMKYRHNGGTRHLILAGKMQESDIEKLLMETQKEIDGITYLDYVDDDKKNELFSHCGCFVFPSKAEGFGMPVLELMKYNKPIILSNLPIYDEIIGDCVNRFELDDDEAVQIDNLAEAMESYEPAVDEFAYKEAVARYAPERLGSILREFILDGVE